ncbi:MAG: hypothetical protein K6F00_05585 [Lachnospiraceae bacterium]|nr:hypothetical protein [Lachnospiraceae bacterium]
MKNKLVTGILMAALLVSMTACGGNKEAAETTTEQTTESTDTAEGEKTEDTAEETTEMKDHKSSDGWTVKYDPSLIAVTEENGITGFAYIGDSAGTNGIYISYVKDKQPQEVLGEMTSEWDQETLERTEGYFGTGSDKWSFTYSYPFEDGGSQAHESITALEYNGGVLVIDQISHLAGDEEIDMAVSDTLATVLDTMEFEDFQAQEQYSYIPGKYTAKVSDEIDGEKTEVTYSVTLNDDHTGVLSLQDDVDVIWESIDMITDDGTKYDFNVEGDYLYLDLDGETIEFTREG